MFSIKPFEVGDQKEARQLILAGLGEHFGFIDQTCNPDIDDIAANYLDKGHIFLVAKVGTELIGTGGLLIQGINNGQIIRISVAPAYRRQGIGQALVEYLCKVAYQRKLNSLLVETNKEWGAAINLYKRLGFIEYKRNAVSVYMSREL